MNLFGGRKAHFLAIFVLTLAGALTPAVQAQISAMTADGWHTWRVPAVRGAPEMCCFSWSSGNITRRGCDLDRRHGGFNTSSDGEFASDEVQMYALLENGDVTDLRALSSSCPVTSDSAIADLGPVTADESLEWLQGLLDPPGKLASEAVAAVAVHEGSRAGRLLLGAARSGDDEVREDAVFWMAQVRIGEMADEVKSFVFDDRDPDMREHAAFAYSQSGAANVNVISDTSGGSITLRARSQ